MNLWLGALAALAVALVLRLEYVVYALYAFLALLAWSRHTALRWVRRVQVDRTCTLETAEIGERASVTVTIRHAGPGRIPWLLVEEGLPADALRQHPPRLRARLAPVSVTTLASGESHVIRYEVEFLLRGYYQFGPLLLESGDLFGLHRRYEIASTPCFVLVRPRPVPLTGYDLASRRPVGEIRLRHRLHEDPTRIAGVRPYATGDPLNRIHWRATARTGALHSKVLEPSCVAGATLLLDFHRDSFVQRRHRPVLDRHLARQLAAAGASDVTAELQGPEGTWVELAITTVASLAHALYLQNQPVGLVTNGRDAADRIRTEGWRHEFRSRAVARSSLACLDPNDRLQPVTVETRRGPRTFQHILDSLARLELTDGLAFSELVHETESRLPRHATVAAVLSRVTEETAATLGRLRRGGFAVIAILVSLEETDLHDWASPPEWAERLLAEGISYRRVQDEESLQRLCAEHVLR